MFVVTRTELIEKRFQRLLCNAEKPEIHPTPKDIFRRLLCNVEKLETVSKYQKIEISGY